MFIVAFIAALISSSVLAGIAVAKSTKIVPTYGGEHSEGILGQPSYINPVIASTEADKNLVRLIFSNIKDVADKIEILNDGRLWKIRLKENIRWQDGEKLTSDDVIFTVQKIQDPDSSSPLSSRWQGVAADRLSEIELQFSLANPYAFFSDTLGTLYILPKHLFADVPPANWHLSDYNIKPVGSGPYKFLSYEKRPDGFIYLYRLEAWDRYFEKKPFIKNFNFQFFVRTDDLIKSFNSGQIDGIGGLEPQSLTELKRPYETFSFALPSYYAVFLNQSKSIPLKELEVRRALAVAIEGENLVAEILGGRGKVALGPIPEGTPYFNAELQKGRVPGETAEDILDKAGWKKNNDGYREKNIKNAVVKLELNIIVPQINFLTKTAVLLKDAWEKAGIKTNLIIQPPEEISRNTIKNRDYEMLLFGNVLGPSFDLFSFWHSGERFYPGLNLSLYNNKKADSLIESIRQNLDTENRRAQFNELQMVILNDQPAIFLYSPDYIYISNKDLGGPEARLIAEPADRFVGASNWYLKTARVLK